MKIRLAVGDTITAVLSGAKTSLDCKVMTQITNMSGDQTIWTSTNGATPVTLATGVNTLDTLESIRVVNTDTGAITITLKHVVGGTGNTIGKYTLAVSDSLQIDSNGTKVIDVYGQVKQSSALAVPTALTGPFTGLVGASTAAAGSTYADAGALPAGTGNIYPTTAADDTKGVIINVADQVTGRTLNIGNGVSNKILKVYGPAGAVINGASANAAFSSASGKGVMITCLSGVGNTWLAW